MPISRDSVAVTATAARASRPWPDSATGPERTWDMGKAYPRPVGARSADTVAFLWRNRGGAGRSAPQEPTTQGAVPGWDNPATDQEDTWTTR